MVSRDLVIRQIYAVALFSVFNPLSIDLFLEPQATPMPRDLYLILNIALTISEIMISLVTVPYVLRTLDIVDYKDAFAITAPPILIELLLNPVLSLYSVLSSLLTPPLPENLTDLMRAALMYIYDIWLLIAYWFVLAYVLLVFARVHRAGGFSNRLVYYGALVMALGSFLILLSISAYSLIKFIPINSPAYAPLLEVENVAVTVLAVIGLAMFVIGHRRSRAAKVIEAVRQ